MHEEQLTARIAQKTAERVAGAWRRLRLRAVLLGREAHYALHVTRPDGSEEAVDPGLAMHRDVRELRALMYREREGTWFTMTLTLAHGALPSVLFDEDEPEIGLALSDGAFRDDCARFPRDADHTPPWLRAKLGADSPT